MISSMGYANYGSSGYGRYGIKSSSINDTITLMSLFIEDVIKYNHKKSRMHSQFKNCITPFNSVTIPNISINNYINRIVYFTNITSEVLLSVLIYFERIIKAVRCADSTKRCDDHLIENNELHRFSSHYEHDMHFSKGFNNSVSLANFYLVAKKHYSGFCINPYNVHRLLLTAIVIAHKFNSDVFYNNSKYAKIGGVSTDELNSLEKEFLFLIGFKLMVQASEVDRLELRLSKKFITSAPPISPTSPVFASSKTLKKSVEFKSRQPDRYRSSKKEIKCATRNDVEKASRSINMYRKPKNNIDEARNYEYRYGKNKYRHREKSRRNSDGNGSSTVNSEEDSGSSRSSSEYESENNEEGESYYYDDNDDDNDDDDDDDDGTTSSSSVTSKSQIIHSLKDRASRRYLSNIKQHFENKFAKLMKNKYAKQADDSVYLSPDSVDTPVQKTRSTKYY